MLVPRQRDDTPLLEPHGAPKALFQSSAFFREGVSLVKQVLRLFNCLGSYI